MENPCLTPPPCASPALLTTPSSLFVHSTKKKNETKTPVALFFIFQQTKQNDPPQFDYDNGFGDRTGRFVFDLYKAEGYMEAGGGDCGTWSDALCDKPTTGCRDTREFFF